MCDAYGKRIQFSDDAALLGQGWDEKRDYFDIFKPKTGPSDATISQSKLLLCFFRT